MILASVILKTDSDYSIKKICIPKVRSDLFPPASVREREPGEQLQSIYSRPEAVAPAVPH